MSDIIVPRKNITIGVVLGVVALIVAAIIAYNIGTSRNLRKQNSLLPNNNSGTTSGTYPTGNNTYNPGNNITSSSPTVKVEPAEIKVGGEPIIVQGKTILNGTIFKVASDSMVLSVVGQTLNIVTKTFNSKVTTYNVIFNKTTKFSQYSSTVIMAMGGGTPQVKTTTKKLTAADLQEDQAVTVVTNDPVTSKTLTALEVRVAGALK